MGNGRTNGFTAAPPATDALGDDIAAVIDARIEARVRALMPRLGTITSINGTNAQVSVQEWDEDVGGEQFRARTAGTNFAAGDTVWLVPVPGGDYVVGGKVANSNAERAVVGAAELQNDAVRAQHIGAGQIIPSKLAQQYTTAQDVNSQIQTARPGIIDAARAGMATAASLADAISNINAALQARVTAVQMNAAIAAAPVKVHTHWADQVFTSTSDTVQASLVALRNLAICAYDKRNQGGNPCSNQRAQAVRIA